jgi:hypothetical protein
MLDILAQGDAIPGWPPGRAMEYIILRAFEIEGAEVTWPYEVLQDGQVIEQIDGAVCCDGLNCLVESKDTSEAIDIVPIAKMRHQLARRPPGSMGIIISRSGFTMPVSLQMRMLTPLNVLLWGFEELQAAIRKRTMRVALQLKYKYAVQLGEPNANVEEEL